MLKSELQDRQVEAFVPYTSIEKLAKSSWFIKRTRKPKFSEDEMVHFPGSISNKITKILM
jgi:hypothetical protein